MITGILDRSREKELTALVDRAGVTMVLTSPGHGTATGEVLDFNGLEAREKAVIFTVAEAEKKDALFHIVQRDLKMDIPGNGILLASPIKSVGGRKTLDYLSNNQTPDEKKPPMAFDHELILVIANQGSTDLVMDAARAAGARGGTVIHAKGTATQNAGKFLGVSIASEKEMVFIASSAERKTEIMQAVMREAGPESPAGAICFSLPVSDVVGIRRFDE